MLKPEQFEFLPSTGNLLENPAFTEGGLEPWVPTFAAGAVGKVNVRDGMLCARIEDRGPSGRAFSLRYPVIVRPQSSYELQFAVSSDVAAELKVAVSTADGAKSWGGTLMSYDQVKTYRSGQFVVEGRASSVTIEFELGKAAASPPYSVCLGKVILAGPRHAPNLSICLGTQLEPRSPTCDRALQDALGRTGIPIRFGESGCDAKITIQANTYATSASRSLPTEKIVSPEGSAVGHFYVATPSYARDEKFATKSETSRLAPAALGSEQGAHCEALFRGLTGASSFFKTLGEITSPDELLAMLKNTTGSAPIDEMVRTALIETLSQYGEAVGRQVTAALRDYLDAPGNGGEDLSACGLMQRLPALATHVAKAQLVIASALTSGSACMRKGARDAARAMGQLPVLRPAIEQALARGQFADEAQELQLVLRSLAAP